MGWLIKEDIELKLWNIGETTYLVIYIELYCDSFWDGDVGYGWDTLVMAVQNVMVNSFQEILGKSHKSYKFLV